MDILVQALFDNSSQNPKIMRVLSEEWRNMGHRVIVFYPCSSRKRVSELNLNDDVYSFYFPDKKKYKLFLNQLDECHTSFIRKLKCSFIHPLSAIEFLLRRTPFFKIYFDESHIIKRETEKAVRKYKVDIVFSGSNPFFFPLGLARAKVNCKRIWFQMDPHASNGMMSAKSAKREFAKERIVYECMDRIFVQPNSYKDIIDNLNTETRLKVFASKFPLIIPDSDVIPDKSYFSSNTVNCVYAGALMLPIRRPDYLFKIFSLFNNTSIRLYIWSGNLSKTMEEEIKSMLPSNVLYCGSLPQREMQAVLAGADILVNIGNTITNQLPSKLLDYMSLKKPILNIYKIDECPTLEILKDYPLSISVSENENVEMASRKIENFILSNIGESVDVETVKKYYRDYFPSSVAEYMLET